MSKSEGSEIDRAILASCLTHPTRSKLIQLLACEAPATVAELGPLLEIPDRTVRDHLLQLRKGHIAVAVGRKQRGGMSADEYALHTGTCTAMADLVNELSPGQYRRLRMQTARLAFDGLASALRHRTLERRPDHAFSWWQCKVDETAWGDLSALRDRVLAEVEQIVAASRRRAAGSNVSDPVLVSLGLFLLEQPSNETQKFT